MSEKTASKAQSQERVNPVKACAVEKQRYDACFKEWYRSQFLKGARETSTECDELFDELQVCINDVMDKARAHQSGEGT